MRNFCGTKLTLIMFLGIIFIMSVHFVFHQRPTTLVNLTALNTTVADTYLHRSIAKSHPAAAISKVPEDVHTAAADNLNKSRPYSSSSRVSTTDRSRNWQPDWFTSDADTATILRERRRQILHRCEVLIHSKEFRSRNRPKSVPEIWGITQPFHNLQYCATYKAGYTFWKYLFGANPGKIDEASLIKPEFTAQRNSPHTIFTVTRNPWHRLVSVWRDRMGGHHGPVQAIMQHFCLGMTWPNMPSFRDFIKNCVLANWKYDHIMDQHWSPVIEKCAVCDGYKFDFFIAQENMNTEAAYMLTRQGMINASTVLPKIQALARRPDEGKEAGYSAKYQDEYKNMSADIIEQLRQIYKWEIFLFDYPDTPFVDFPNA